MDQAIYRVNQPFIFTVFGASGDLAQIMIFPAIFALAEQNRFQSDFKIFGYARTKMDDTAFRVFFAKSVKDHYQGDWGDYQEGVLEALLPHVHYFSGQYDQAEDFKRYSDVLNKKCIQGSIFISYFSVPPFLAAPIAINLATAMDPQTHDMRLVLEKPFGHDEASAQELFGCLRQYYSEDQLYLLDHYLGKKAVRSLIPLRHMNRILNTMLKGKEIANIQITSLETVGVGERLGYFDEVGTIKDFVQSHLLQILAMLTMSIPIDANAERITEERAAILEALDFKPEISSLVLGQYEGYKSENESVKASDTDTFAALKLGINRESWYGVPIFLRTGKKLDRKYTALIVELKKFAFQPEDQEPNRVIIEFYPHESIQIRMLDEDGATLRHGEIEASQSIACMGDYCLPAHGLLFLDVIRADKRYFLSMGEILASWRIIDKVMTFIKAEALKPEIYAEGTRGPKTQSVIPEAEGFRWYDND